MGRVSQVRATVHRASRQHIRSHKARLELSKSFKTFNEVRVVLGRPLMLYSYWGSQRDVCGTVSIQILSLQAN